MFSKSPRFRGAGSNSPELRVKTPSYGGRESGRPESVDLEDFYQSGSYGTKKATAGNDQGQDIKRPHSTDRKTIPLDKKNNSQRELKRTTSFIPRATIQKPKPPNTTEVKKSGRKSETSLKEKGLFEDVSLKDKKLDVIKGSKTANSLTTNLSNDNNDPDRKTQDGSKIINPKVTDGQELSTKLSRNGTSKGNASHDGLNRERPDSRARKIKADQTSESAPVGKSLEAQYAAKKTVYGLMVKEYQEKQKAIVDQYNVLQDIREQIMSTSHKVLMPEESIKIGNVGPPFVIDPSLINGKTENIITYESKILNDLSVDFTDFQNTYETLITENRDIWLQLTMIFMNSRGDLLRQIKNRNPCLDIDEFQENEKSLELAVETAKYHSKLKMDDLIAEIRKLFSNRETIKQELALFMDTDKISLLTARECRELAAKLKEVQNELIKEKIRTEDLKEKKTILEETNQTGSEKIENLEQIVSEQQSKLQQLAYQYKSLKQKEYVSTRGMAGIKAKDIKDLKAKSELLKNLENRMTELTNDYNAQKKTFQDKISKLELSLAEKDEALKTEIQTTQTLEASLADAEERLKNIREKKKIFVDMVDKTKQILQNTSSSSNKREEQLWTELETTKIVIKGYQDQITKLTEEKNKLLLKFETISEDKSNQNTQRLAADVIRKEEIIKNLKGQVTDLQLACEEHSAKYNKLLNQIKEVHEKMDGKTDAAALTKQLGDVKMQKKELQEVVKELVTHNEELETALVQRTLELDQRDRLVKQQCNLLKMRDELTDLVRSKDDAQCQGVKKVLEQGSKWEKKAEKIYKDMEKKANELDDMYKVLLDKQKQIEKLTKLVKMMEDQQNRAQEQRVRFESKIAELQRQLSEGQPKQVKTQLFGD